MRKLSLLFALVLCCISIGAQEQVLLLDSIVTSSAYGLTDKEVYTYSGGQDATDYMVYNASVSGGWDLARTYRLSYVYDENGRATTCNETLSTGSGWVLMSRKDITYYSDGSIDTETHWSLSAVGNTWSPITRDVYHYSADGSIESIDNELYDNGSWTPYITLAINEASSTAEKRVFDRYWTGYEEEGTDGQAIFYYSMHLTSALNEARLNAAPHKIIRDGQVLIISGRKTFTTHGIELK